ncbi:uncharacterized protein LOC131942247 [Physella acuta]|uniref:uncharacterized protein LOC131942247 n=1 Tax=Physella acuta TaxID=109671 RepID=UPI0027DE24EE|nr:uncharacterized protein LOC131942247 [Physella acuta]XP_059157988.1 uncharacterized protein LOC131942247 [Physella acuta]
MGNVNKKPEFSTLTGNHEAEMCYGGEADLHTRVTDCKKNPGHKGFIPLKDFNASCLPSRYHNDLMSETIKALAALTVQVKSEFTSLERPEFYPDTQVPYPCYKDRGSHVMRLGTGRVWYVIKYTESDRKSCRCAKCQVSATPSKVWGKVFVTTATHVVFDDSEARQTRCVLGFDDNKSPVVSLDGWEVKWGGANIEGDRCYLRYETCDLELVDELDKMWRHFDHLCWKVSEKYKYGRFFGLNKLTVIVSHPHGCPKQVSVGQWTHKRERDGVNSKVTRYWYTTCTCPGSSGATVYRLRHDEWFYLHPHSGSNPEGNYSGECV